jgi:hypothetical protein
VHEADVAAKRLDALPESQRRAIASGNAQRVFRL